MAIGADFRDLPTPDDMCVAMRRRVCTFIFMKICCYKETLILSSLFIS